MNCKRGNAFHIHSYVSILFFLLLLFQSIACVMSFTHTHTPPMALRAHISLKACCQHGDNRSRKHNHRWHTHTMFLWLSEGVSPMAASTAFPRLHLYHTSCYKTSAASSLGVILVWDVSDCQTDCRLNAIIMCLVCRQPTTGELCRSTVIYHASVIGYFEGGWWWVVFLTNPFVHFYIWLDFSSLIIFLSGLFYVTKTCFYAAPVHSSPLLCFCSVWVIHWLWIITLYNPTSKYPNCVLKSKNFFLYIK